MSINHPYLQKVYQQVCERDPHEPEFLNAVNEVLGTLEPVIRRHPEYEAAGSEDLDAVSGCFGGAGTRRAVPRRLAG